MYCKDVTVTRAVDMLSTLGTGYSAVVHTDTPIAKETHQTYITLCHLAQGHDVPVTWLQKYVLTELRNTHNILFPHE